MHCGEQLKAIIDSGVVAVVRTSSPNELVSICTIWPVGVSSE